MGNLANKLTAKSPEFKNMFLGQFPEQQLKAGNSEKYYQTLTDFDFISLKIQSPNFGVEALIKDYDLMANPEILENLEDEEKLENEKIKTLKLIQNALQLSAHVLSQDTNQLVSQLWGRLQSFQNSDIQKLLQDAEQSKSEIPRFRPITASLTTPNGKLLRTLTGHDNAVRAVVITPDGKKAVSASDDHTLKIWDLDTGTEILTLTGHYSYVNAVAITPDGNKVVSASDDNTLKLWDLETGKETFTLTGHYSCVNAVAIAPDGKTAVSGSDDHTLKFWDLETSLEIFTLTGHENWVNAVAIAPDSQKAISSSDDKTLKLWNLETGKEISTFTGDSSIISCAVSPDGFTVAAGEQSGRVHFLQLELPNMLKEMK
ncbi:MAG: WD40 repeat domain-containing protein [Cuspidothrix sp.]